MNRVPDRKRLRREYLRKKGTAYVKAGLAATVYIPLAVVTVFLALGALYSWIGWQCWWDRAADPGSHWDWYAIWLTVMTLISGSLWFLCGLFYKRSVHSLHDIDYVPPVTPSTLPTEEVLVRSAEEPSAPSETLLRTAGTGEETRAEELLRSSHP